MGWSADFLAELERTDVEPRFLVEFVKDYHDTIGESATFAAYGSRYARLIGSEVSVGAGRVGIGSWSYTHGGFSVLVVDDEASGLVYDLLSTVTRGNVARLLVGWPGWDEDDFEPVALGALRGVSGTSPEFVFVFDSILTHWATRHDSNTARLALFDSLDTGDDRVSTAVTAKWDASVGGAISVTSTANFDRGTGGVGALLLSDPNYGAPFFVTYTGETATTFTGISTTDLHFTTPVCLGATGATASACAYMTGHPFDIALQVLLSTGTGDHGSSDVLPAEWGFAALPDWVDEDDVDDWKEVVGNKSGTDHDWSVLVEESQTNAIGWLSGLLSEAGAWLVVRQGRISLRAAQNTYEGSIYRFGDLRRASISLTDDDIASVLSYEFWNPDVPAEAAVCRVWYSPSHHPGSADAPSSESVTDSVYGLPAYQYAEHDLTDVVFTVFDDPAEDVAYRCHPWETRVGELAKVVCRGLRAAQLAPGDVVPVTSSQLRGRLDRTRDGWNEVDALVVSVSVDWMSASVTVELSVAPHVTGL